MCTGADDCGEVVGGDINVRGHVGCVGLLFALSPDATGPREIGVTGGAGDALALHNRFVPEFAGGTLAAPVSPAVLRVFCAVHHLLDGQLLQRA